MLKKSCHRFYDTGRGPTLSMFTDYGYGAVAVKYRAQVNVASIPYNRREGDVPALNDADIDAIVAFLQTLTDARYESVP